MSGRIGAFASVSVFGGITMDRIGATASAPVMGASNPGTVRSVPGGVGFNVAGVLARLGVRTRLIGAVGRDGDGEAALSAARGAGVDPAATVVADALPTATYHASFDHAGSLIVGIADMRVYDELTPALVARAAAAAPATDLFVIDANLSPDTIDFLVTEAGSRRLPVVALSVSPAKARRLTPVLDRVNLLFANRREAIAILGREERDRAASSLAADISRSLGPDAVVTNAGEPLAVGIGGEVRSLATLKAAVKSVNGAGDALSAGTLHGLALGRPLAEAVLGGLAAAAITVESGGVLQAAFSPDALAARLGARRSPR